jgi:hypothetical protein
VGDRVPYSDLSEQITVEEAAALDPRKLELARRFDEDAVDAGKGGAAASPRVQLMPRILELQQRVH